MAINPNQSIVVRFCNNVNLQVALKESQGPHALQIMDVCALQSGQKWWNQQRDIATAASVVLFFTQATCCGLKLRPMQLT